MTQKAIRNTGNQTKFGIMDLAPPQKAKPAETFARNQRACGNIITRHPVFLKVPMSLAGSENRKEPAYENSTPNYSRIKNTPVLGGISMSLTIKKKVVGIF